MKPTRPAENRVENHRIAVPLECSISVVIARWFETGFGYASDLSMDDPTVADVATCVTEDMNPKSTDGVTRFEHTLADGRRVVGERLPDNEILDEKARDRRPYIVRMALVSPAIPRWRDRQILEELRKMPLPTTSEQSLKPIRLKFASPARTDVEIEDAVEVSVSPRLGGWGWGAVLLLAAFVLTEIGSLFAVQNSDSGAAHLQSKIKKNQALDSVSAPAPTAGNDGDSRAPRSPTPEVGVDGPAVQTPVANEGAVAPPQRREGRPDRADGRNDGGRTEHEPPKALSEPSTLTARVGSGSIQDRFAFARRLVGLASVLAFCALAWDVQRRPMPTNQDVCELETEYFRTWAIAAECSAIMTDEKVERRELPRWREDLRHALRQTAGLLERGGQFLTASRRLTLEDLTFEFPTLVVALNSKPRYLHISRAPARIGVLSLVMTDQKGFLVRRTYQRNAHGWSFRVADIKEIPPHPPVHHAT